MGEIWSCQDHDNGVEAGTLEKGCEQTCQIQASRRIVVPDIVGGANRLPVGHKRGRIVFVGEMLGSDRSIHQCTNFERIGIDETSTHELADRVDDVTYARIRGIYMLDQSRAVVRIPKLFRARHPRGGTDPAYVPRA